MVKPSKKSRRDGKVMLWDANEYHQSLCVVGDYSQNEIILLAVKSGDIDSGGSGWFGQENKKARYYQDWFKAVPSSNGDYMMMYYPSRSEVKGSVFCSVIEITY